MYKIVLFYKTQSKTLRFKTLCPPFDVLHTEDLILQKKLIYHIIFVTSLTFVYVKDLRHELPLSHVIHRRDVVYM